MYLVSPLLNAAEAVDVLAAHEDAEDPVLHLPKLPHLVEADAALRASRLPSRHPSDREGGGGALNDSPTTRYKHTIVRHGPSIAVVEFNSTGSEGETVAAENVHKHDKKKLYIPKNVLHIEGSPSGRLNKVSGGETDADVQTRNTSDNIHPSNHECLKKGSKSLATSIERVEHPTDLTRFIYLNPLRLVEGRFPSGHLVLAETLARVG